MTNRDVIIALMSNNQDIDKSAHVRILERNSEGTVIRKSIAPVHYVYQIDGAICIDLSKIEEEE